MLTSYPDFASSEAAAIPAGPAPMTATFCLWALFANSLRRHCESFQNCRLHFGNVDGKVNAAARAGLHAEFVRTDKAAGLPHRIGAGNGLDRFAVSALLGVVNKLLRIAVDRTGMHTGLVFAVQTTVKFRFKLDFAQICFFASDILFSAVVFLQYKL